MKLVNIFTGEVSEGFVASGFDVPLLETPETSDAEDTKTEQSYIPPEQQIADMEKAGRFLDEVRRARFSPEFDSDLGYQEEEEIALDPTRSPGVDMADIARLAHATGARMREQDRKDKEARQAAADAAAKAQLDAAVAAEVSRRASAGGNAGSGSSPS